MTQIGGLPFMVHSLSFNYSVGYDDHILLSPIFLQTSSLFHATDPGSCNRD